MSCEGEPREGESHAVVRVKGRANLKLNAKLIVTLTVTPTPIVSHLVRRVRIARPVERARIVGEQAQRLP